MPTGPAENKERPQDAFDPKVLEAAAAGIEKSLEWLSKHLPIKAAKMDDLNPSLPIEQEQLLATKQSVYRRLLQVQEIKV